MKQLNLNISDIVDDKKSNRSKLGGTFLYISDNSTAYLKLNDDDSSTVRGICGEFVKFMFLESERAAILTGGGSRKLAEVDVRKGGRPKRYQISVANQELKDRLESAFGTGSVSATLEPAKLADGTLCVYVQFDDGSDAR